MTDNEKLIEELRTTVATGPASRYLLDRAAAALEDAEKAHTPTDDEREARAIVRRAVGGVLFHVTNFPERAQSHLLGENMGPLNEKITEAVLAALGLPVSRDLVRRVDVALSVIAHEGGDVRVKQALDYVKAAFANQSLILDLVAPEPQGEPSDAQMDRLIEAALVALIHDPEVPTAMRPQLLGGEVLVIRERTDAEPIVSAVIHAVSRALRAAGGVR